VRRTVLYANVQNTTFIHRHCKLPFLSPLRQGRQGALQSLHINIEELKSKRAWNYGQNSASSPRPPIGALSLDHTGAVPSPNPYFRPPAKIIKSSTDFQRLSSDSYSYFQGLLNSRWHWSVERAITGGGINNVGHNNAVNYWDPVYTIQPVVQPLDNRLYRVGLYKHSAGWTTGTTGRTGFNRRFNWQPRLNNWLHRVTKQTFNRLNNLYDKRLYRINGVWKLLAKQQTMTCTYVHFKIIVSGFSALGLPLWRCLRQLSSDERAIKTHLQKSFKLQFWFF